MSEIEESHAEDDEHCAWTEEHNENINAEEPPSTEAVEATNIKATNEESKISMLLIKKKAI